LIADQSQIRRQRVDHISEICASQSINNLLHDFYSHAPLGCVAKNLALLQKILSSSNLRHFVPKSLSIKVA